MKNFNIRIAAIMVALIMMFYYLEQTTVKPPLFEAKIGSQAPDFTLKDVNGNEISLNKLKKHVVILEWVEPQCKKVINNYKSRAMQDTQKFAKKAGATWLTINSFTKKFKDASKVGKLFMDQYKSNTQAFLIDEDASAARKFGVSIAPHIFIIDKTGKVVYSGKAFSKNKEGKRENLVKKALASMIMEEPIATSFTVPSGCKIK